MQEMQEKRVQSQGQEDLLEQEMATHSSFFAWKIPWAEEPCGLQPMGQQRIGHNWAQGAQGFKKPLLLGFVDEKS